MRALHFQSSSQTPSSNSNGENRHESRKSLTHSFIQSLTLFIQCLDTMHGRWQLSRFIWINLQFKLNNEREKKIYMKALHGLGHTTLLHYTGNQRHFFRTLSLSCFLCLLCHTKPQYQKKMQTTLSQNATLLTGKKQLKKRRLREE